MARDICYSFNQCVYWKHPGAHKHSIYNRGSHVIMDPKILELPFWQDLIERKIIQARRVVTTPKGAKRAAELIEVPKDATKTDDAAD